MGGPFWLHTLEEEWLPLGKREGQRQFGYWGQWMAPRARTKYHDGSYATALGSTEGGLFTKPALGRTHYPKYLAGASIYAYTSYSDVGRGWGFYEKAIECKYLGLIYLSNRVLVPPSGYSFEPDQDTHATDGGIYHGAAWMSLPFFGGKQRIGKTVNRDENDGKITLTHMIDTAQFTGPLIACT